MSAWSVPPELFADVVEENIDNTAKGFALTCYRNIIMESPVETGRFRASHVLSHVAPDYTIMPEGSLGMSFLSEDTLIANAESILKAIPKGSLATLYIQTNLPYAQALENGHSKQASAGVYGPAFNAAVVKYS